VEALELPHFGLEANRGRAEAELRVRGELDLPRVPFAGRASLAGASAHA
jgi:hypothetical protein